jgi:hypothetical protein
MMNGDGGMITRSHFYGYRPDTDPDSPPWHVISMNPAANWVPLPRPLPTRAQPGPQLVYGGGGMPNLGIDPTDPATWSTRGYRQSAGMIGRFNGPGSWGGNVEELNPLGAP